MKYILIFIFCIVAGVIYLRYFVLYDSNKIDGALDEKAVSVSDKKKSLKDVELDSTQVSELLTEEFWRNVTPKELKEKLKSIKNINKIRSKDNKNVLHFLIEYGQYPEMVNLLIKAGVDYRLKSNSVIRGKALHYAVIRRNKALEFTKEILKYDTNINELGGSSGREATCLMWALYLRAPIEVIKLLLEKGADPHLRSEEGSHSLLAASIPNYEGNSFIDPKVIKLLLDYNVDITVKNSEGKTAYDFMKENEEFKKTALFQKISIPFQNR